MNFGFPQFQGIEEPDSARPGDGAGTGLETGKCAEAGRRPLRIIAGIDNLWEKD